MSYNVIKTNPRPHAELVKKWLDDDKMEIEFFNEAKTAWEVTDRPSWHGHIRYRAKPKELVAKYKIAYETTGSGNSYVTSAFYLSAADFESQHTHLKFKWIEAIHSSKKLFDE